MEVTYSNASASEAMTWVAEVSECMIPYAREAMDMAASKGVHIGLHVPSKSIVVAFDTLHTRQHAQAKLGTIFGKAGVSKGKVQIVESLDLYHAERWGIVRVLPPSMPEYTDTLVEEDELDSDVEAAADPPGQEAAPEAEAAEEMETAEDVSETILVQKDVFDLVSTHASRKIVVPDIVKALGMDTSHQRDLRASMEAAGGSLSPYLQDILFPRGQHHVREVQEEARALARKKGDQPIFWVTEPPLFLTVYGKPNMSTARRVEWIVWKAEKLGLELTLPVFMAFYKQVTFHERNNVRLAQFKATVEFWRGERLDWKALPSEERNLIVSINEGKLDCYCKSCHRVVDPKASSDFCCASCAGSFCRCGAQKKSRWISDYARLEAMQKQVGPYHHLVDLATMLRYREEVDLCRSPCDLSPKFEALTERRRGRKCCEAVDGFVDNRWCRRCLTEFSHLNAVSKCVERIRSGKVTWGHCQEAARLLEKLQRLPMPQVEEKYCDEPRCKGRP